MIELTEFSLNTDPSFGQVRSQLVRNGQPIPLHVEGTVLRYQFETAHGYLFITDHDCFFEESTHLILCSLDYRTLSRRSFGWPYCSFYLERVEWLDASHLVLDLGADDRRLVTLRPWGIPYLHPRLGISKWRGNTPGVRSAGEAA